MHWKNAVMHLIWTEKKSSQIRVSTFIGDFFDEKYLSRKIYLSCYYWKSVSPALLYQYCTVIHFASKRCKNIEPKSNGHPVIHFQRPYITSDLGPFLSPYITFESNIQALWSPYITFESNIRALWSPYITSKIYTSSKLDPACAK